MVYTTITEANVFVAPMTNIKQVLETVNSKILVKTSFSKDSEIPIITYGNTVSPVYKHMDNSTVYSIIFTINAIHNTAYDSIVLAEAIKNALNSNESLLARYNMEVNTRARITEAIPIERSSTSRFFITEVVVEYKCL